jgi:phosphoribosylformylglycinamidine synthase
VLRGRFRDGTDLSGELLAILGSPTVADKSWIWRQYDHQLFCGTVMRPGADAAVLRLPGTRRAVAVSTDGNARFCQLDPRAGGRLAVLEATRNVACAGARSLAIVNCLNFGNPERPEVMWQFAEVVEGMSESCEALGLPVVGGNVSFYNESHGRGIDPTPVVGALGVIDRLDDPVPPPTLVDGDEILVVGRTAAELGGSEWAATLHGLPGGLPPAAELDGAARLHELLRALVADRDVTGVHDCAEGGLAVTLAEMAFRGGVGFRVDLSAAPGSEACSVAERCFSESASRAVVSVPRELVAAVLARAATAGVDTRVVGRAGGERLACEGAFDVEMMAARRAWEEALPQAVDVLARTAS